MAMSYRTTGIIVIVCSALCTGLVYIAMRLIEARAIVGLSTTFPYVICMAGLLLGVFLAGYGLVRGK
jgi:hypothetical protein